jgi:hypothetical protein
MTTTTDENTGSSRSLEDIAYKCVVFDEGTIIAAGAPHDILHHDRDLLKRSNLMHSHRRSRSPMPGHVHQAD